jgi:hypothetical protein
MISSMVAWLLRLGLLSGICLAEISQVSAGDASGSRPGGAESEGQPGVEIREVVAERLAVYDGRDEKCFRTGTVERGDRVRVRRWLAGGWAAIDPPATAIAWVERASLELSDEGGERGGHRLGPAEPGSGPPARATVVVPRAIVRSGQLGARMPGPPWVELPRGTMVQLVDRPPLSIGRGPGATLWFAAVPPVEVACYVRAAGLEDARPREGIPEMLAAYLVPEGGDTKSTAPAPESLPLGVAAEIGRVDAMHRAILTGQPVEQWRFEAVRAEYQAILKRSGDNPAVEAALRVRLAGVTRHEQAAAAAREFQDVLARSRRRDAEVAQLKQQLAAVDRYRSPAYHAIGYVQPSSQVLDGRKLHALIGLDGRTVAYLDIPPGLDVEAVGVHRVGVRGTVHYNPELGTRLITVRDLEPVGTRR